MLNKKVTTRLRRKARVRAKINGTSERPRLVVYKSLSNIYAQIVDDQAGKTLVNTSDLKLKTKDNKSIRAKNIGVDIAKKALEKNIKQVVFDRNGYQYHGRVKAVAEGAREGGLKF